jgi:hypothetical protein
VHHVPSPCDYFAGGRRPALCSSCKWGRLVSAAICPECRGEMITSASAALSILADDNADQSERTLASKVLMDRAHLVR